MADIFATRNLMSWWVALSATVFLKDWLKSLSSTIKSSDVFLPDRFPFNAVPSINAGIDGLSEAIRAAIQFKPEQELVAVGEIHVLSWILAVIVGLALVGFAIWLYVRSLRSATWFDDLIALLVIYVTLRIEGHIVAIAKLPIQEEFRAFVNNPTTAFVTLLALLLILIFFGEGIRSRRAVLRALVEVTVLAVFIFPRETATAIAAGIMALSEFGSSLSQLNPFALIWGAVGMLLAAKRLIGHERVEINRY